MTAMQGALPLNLPARDPALSVEVMAVYPSEPGLARQI